MGVIRLLAGLFEMGVLMETGDGCFPSFFATTVFPLSSAIQPLFVVVSIIMHSGSCVSGLLF